MKYISVLIAVLISLSVTGQSYLLEEKGDDYLYKGQLYSIDELDVLYEDHQKSMDLYLSGLRNKDDAYTIALLGIPFIVGGGLGLMSGGFSPKIIGPLLILSGGAIELIALIQKPIGNWKLRRARSHFNYNMIERHGYQSDISFAFGVTNNGMGLVLQF